MVFSIGDIITLVVVLLILVIYRALDRNNRSLEKLKRFSDKITENLSAFVDEKTTQVKDLSLELQASLKMGKDILARARGVEEVLQARAGDIEAIQNRFAEYDKALVRADRDVGARGQESAAHPRRGGVRRHRRRAGSTIGGAAGEGIEQRIPELEKGFARHSAESLSSGRLRGPRHRRGRRSPDVGDARSSRRSSEGFSTYLARLEAREEQTGEADARSVWPRLSMRSTPTCGEGFPRPPRGRNLEDEVFARICIAHPGRRSGNLAKSMETIESRISDYQGDVDYRVKALEEANADVDALRASPSDQTMEQVAGGVRTEMKALGADLVAGWTAEIAAAAQAREQLHAGMAERGNGLAALKTKAYQDVEKQALRIRGRVLRRPARPVHRHAGEVPDLAGGDGEARSADFESDVKERIASADESVQALRESLRWRSERSKKDAGVAFEKDLAVVRDALEAARAR